MALGLATTNVLHGLVALAWLGGLRRLAGPLPPDVVTRLHVAGVVLPPLVLLLRLAEVPTPEPQSLLLRSTLWAEAFAASSWLIALPAVLLLAGTAVIFALQEALPAWRNRRRHHHLRRLADPALDEALERVQRAFARAHVPAARGRKLVIVRLETQARVAALEGLVAPTILVSAGLLEVLEPDELDAVVAHELAHVVRAGNVGLFAVWIVRVLQAFNPATLVLFRNLVDAREASCDALAAWATGQPAALASALLKSRHDGDLPVGDGALGRARARVLRSADRAAVRLRVEALLAGRGQHRAPWPWTWVGVLALGGVLWFVG